MTIINTKFTVTGLFKEREYRILADFDGKEIAVVEIPGQRKPVAYLASSKSDLINIASKQIEQSRNGDWTYCPFTIKGLKDCFGDEIPAEALAIAVEFGKVIQYNDSWLKPSDADEYQWAIEYLEHDNYGLHTFMTMTDAVVFLEKYNGHGSGDAEEALAEVLCTYGFIELAESDDEE